MRSRASATCSTATRRTTGNQGRSLIKAIRRLRRRITNLLTAPFDELGRWARLVRYQLQLWHFCASRLRRNNAMAMSAALSFRTIFALLPALVLAIMLLKPLGLLETGEVRLSAGLAEFGIPDEVEVTRMRRQRRTTAAGKTTGTGTAATTARDEGTRRRRGRRREVDPDAPRVEVTRKVDLSRMLERRVRQLEEKLTLGSVGPAGVLLLIWTVMALLTTIERSLNRIFDVPHTRPLARRVMLYWSVVTLCPLLLVTAAYLGRSTRDALTGVPVVAPMLRAIGWATPVLVGFIVLALVYALMTNTKVSFRAAMAGAAVTVPLWLLAKWGFSLYVVTFVGPTKIYGLLGLLPLFLIWVNVSWWLFLFGAQVAHTIEALPQLQALEDERHFIPTSSDALAVAIGVARKFLAGEGEVRAVEVAKELRLPTRPVRWMLERLQRVGVVNRLDEDAGHAYALARPPERIDVADVLDVDARAEAVDGPRPHYDSDVAEAIAVFRERTRDALGDYTLADVLAGMEPDDSA